MIHIVLEQQVSIAAARTLFQRLSRHLGEMTPRAVAAHGVTRLRRFGLTRQKASYCHELALAVRDGRLDLGQVARAEDTDGRETLLAMRGLGPWSVDIYYLMALRRPDVWPCGDLALAIAMRDVKRLTGKPGNAEQQQISAPWTPWRSVAARLLWHYYLSKPRSRRTRSSLPDSGDSSDRMGMPARAGSYRTVDRWRSGSDHAEFPAACGKEYRKLDRQCERLTLEERRVEQNLALTPFHLAIPVRDLRGARKFYGELFGCAEGRSSEAWVDFNFFGHQLVCHVAESAARDTASNPVDGHDVPVPHFGMVLEIADWEALARRLKTAGVRFVIEPHLRFPGKPGEQATMFLLDPSGNALEFKAFKDIAGQLFAT
jgi:extradiol dioxygenase family protein